jgi:hypothetical protein
LAKSRYNGRLNPQLISSFTGVFDTGLQLGARAESEYQQNITALEHTRLTNQATLQKTAMEGLQKDREELFKAKVKGYEDTANFIQGRLGNAQNYDRPSELAMRTDLQTTNTRLSQLMQNYDTGAPLSSVPSVTANFNYDTLPSLRTKTEQEAQKAGYETDIERGKASAQGLTLANSGGMFTNPKDQYETSIYRPGVLDIRNQGLGIRRDANDIAFQRLSLNTNSADTKSYNDYLGAQGRLQNLRAGKKQTNGLYGNIQSPEEKKAQVDVYNTYPKVLGSAASSDNAWSDIINNRVPGLTLDPFDYEGNKLKLQDLMTNPTQWGPDAMNYIEPASRLFNYLYP